MKEIKTPIGNIFIRNDWDKAVIQEVINEDGYRRWGDIKIKKGDLVVDCGAHIGTFSKLALSLGAKVIAIEPDADNFKYLKKNTEGYDRIRRLQAVLWNGEKVGFLKDKERGELNKIDGRGVLMPSVSLNTVFETFKVKQCNLLKMDIEGAEYDVLRDFKYLNRVKQISMEWHYGAKNMTWLILFLEDRGFKTVWLGGHDWGKIQFKKI